MSLKAFHVAFIVVATLSMALFSVWSVNAYLADQTPLIMAILTIAATVVLPFYGVWFLKKMKHVSYL